MLKKVGIVTASAVAGLLAISPLAFAGDYDGGHDDHGGHHHGNHHSSYDGSRNVQNGLINVQNVGVQVPIQACGNSLLSGVLGVLSSHQSNKDSHGGSCSQGNGARN